MEAARVPAAGAPRLGSAASPARARRLVLPDRGVVATNRWPAVTDGRPASRAPAAVLQLARAGDARADQGRRGQHGTSVERGLQLTESRAQGVAELARRGLTHPVQRRGAARPIVHARPGGAARSVRCGQADASPVPHQRSIAGRNGAPGTVRPGAFRLAQGARLAGVRPGGAARPARLARWVPTSRGWRCGSVEYCRAERRCRVKAALCDSARRWDGNSRRPSGLFFFSSKKKKKQ
ncbi:unnamed protein product [Urochloa humidicola]